MRLESKDQSSNERDQSTSAVSHEGLALVMFPSSQQHERLEVGTQPKSTEFTAKQMLEAVLKGRWMNAQTMYRTKPELMFIKVEDEVEEYAAKITTRVNDEGGEELVLVHRRVKGLSPFQAALAAGDYQLLEDMPSYFDAVVDTENKPIGRKLAAEQFNEQFPDGDFTYPKSTYNFESLILAITNDDNLITTGEPNDTTKAALLTFKNHYLPGVVTKGHLFNLNDLVKAWELYSSKLSLASRNPWEPNQLTFFCCQVVGGLELAATAVDAQRLCKADEFHHGVDDESRNNSFILRDQFQQQIIKDDKFMEYFPCDLNFLLGRDFAVLNWQDRIPAPTLRYRNKMVVGRGIGAGGRGVSEEEGGFGHMLKSYVEEKNQGLATLRNTLKSEVIVQDSSRIGLRKSFGS